MQIATFIDKNSELVLDACDCFTALSGSPAKRGHSADLRSHAEWALKEIVREMRRLQARGSPAATDTDTDPESTTKLRAADHYAAGCGVDELVDEFRALRFNVLRLWMDAQDLQSFEIEDIAVFNEAVDRLLAETVTHYTIEVGRTQAMFLAMLGHDVRTPLGTIMLAAERMFKDPALTPKNANSAHLILKSVRRVDGLLSDMLDFAVTKLSPKVPVSGSMMNLRDAFEQVRAELCAIYPEHIIRIDASGDLTGIWDRGRICQAVSNVVSNAVEHGSSGHPVSIGLHGDPHFVTARVHNVGDAIDAATLKLIFDPVQRHLLREQEARSRVKKQNLGLGMYIARQIVASHSGDIYIESDPQSGTTCTIRLPRNSRANELN